MDGVKKYTLVFLLLAAFAFAAVTSVYPARKSPTCDELAHHVAPGYVFLDKGDIKMATDSPPLARYIVAAPLKVFMRPVMPDDKAKWRTEDRSEFSKDFFYKYNDQPDRMIFLSRMAVVVAGIICGLILFAWVDSMYGPVTAILSLFFYSLSPNLLAHARLATTDMIATCTILLAVFSLWIFVQKRSAGAVLLAGACLGLAQLAKYTALLLYPIFIVLALFELKDLPRGDKRDLFVKLAAVIVISVAVMWAGYGFDTKPILYDSMRAGEKLEIAHSIAGRVLPFWNDDLSAKLDRLLTEAPFPLGTHVLGVLGVLRHAHEGHGTFFCGEWSSYGNPMYYLLAFFIKTPIPAILFIFIGLMASIAGGRGRNFRFVVLTASVFFLTASFSKLQLGLRYILPVYPFFMILAGIGARALLTSRARTPAVLLMIWYSVASLWIWPDYLGYFNESVGGPANGYKYLRDSNIDWGQDLPALSGYMRDNGIDKVKLEYFGTALPERHGVRWEGVSDKEKTSPGPHVYAISTQAMDRFDWTDGRKPDSMAGYSIRIYDLRKKDRGASI